MKDSTDLVNLLKSRNSVKGWRGKGRKLNRLDSLVSSSVTSPRFGQRWKEGEKRVERAIKRTRGSFQLVGNLCEDETSVDFDSNHFWATKPRRVQRRETTLDT